MAVDRGFALIVVASSLLGLGVCACPTTHATELLFSQESGSFPTLALPCPGKPYDVLEGVILPDEYGDRVTSELQGGFAYGAAGGWTPHVSVAYGNAESVIRTWPTGYGDLQDIVYAGLASYHANIIATPGDITLTADRGYAVSLASFDMGAYGRDYVVRSVEVFDNRGGVLFSQVDVPIPGEAGDERAQFDFSPPLVSSVVRIHWDATNCVNWWDATFDSGMEFIGFDNITFGEVVVPEPSSVALVSIALGLLTGACLRRRS